MDVQAVYEELLDKYGPQGWWPSCAKATEGGAGHRCRPGFDPRFEVMAGAILTQNTAWRNVEKAIEALYGEHCLDAEAIRRVRPDKLKRLIRPAGYYNQKTRKLKELARVSSTWRSKPSREELLDIWGIGRETADSILLYAFDEPIFVVDAYTRRLLRSRGLDRLAGADYDDIREFFKSRLGSDPKLFNEYHALIVRWAKDNNSLDS